MKSILFSFAVFLQVSSQLLLKKENIVVLIGREVYLKPTDLQFQNTTQASVCKVEVIGNEPMTQQVGLLLPQVITNVLHLKFKLIKRKLYIQTLFNQQLNWDEEDKINLSIENCSYFEDQIAI